MAARDVALALARRFLQSGKFVLAGAQGHGPYGALPAAGAIPELPDNDEYGFAGLAVQSVGVEEGVENPRVHIYVTKGSRSAEHEIEVDDEDVVVVVNRVRRALT